MSTSPAAVSRRSVVGSKGLPTNSVYSATKAAVRSFARTWTTDGFAPLGRVGAANEIAKAVVFLASDDSSYVTGAGLFDGGFAQV